MEFKAHLKIEGDRIVAIGSDLVPGPQDAVLDATGLHLLWPYWRSSAF